MAEENGDKTEAPTARRRQEAAEQGQVARSPDLVAAMLLLTTLLLLRATGGQIVNALKAFLLQMLAASSLSTFDASAAMTSFFGGVQQVGLAMLPLLGGTVFVAILGNVLQVGLVFNVDRLSPNFDALNPAQGFSRVFGGGMKPMELLINLVKLVVLGAVAYSAVHGRIGQIVTSQRMAFGQVFLLGAQTVFSISLRLAVALFIIALLEYAYQWWKLEQELKMTKEEVKEEMRRMEGDPKIKARRRQLAIARMREQLKKNVPAADVVVTNPTHFAVALKYDVSSMAAPRVVAKGSDLMARRIREIAVEHGIPILERAPLARALYAACDVGQEVPEEFYTAIAEILAYVYELTGKSREMAERAARRKVPA